MNNSNNITNNGRIVKNTLILYFRMLLTMCIGLYISRAVLLVLGFVDYGLYNVIGGVIAMFGFVNGAMTNTISRFLTFQIGRCDDSKLNNVFSMSCLIQILIGVIVVILGETIGLWFLENKMSIPSERYEAANWVYQLSVLTTFFLIINVPYNAAVIAYERMSAFAYISIVDSILKLGVVFLISISSEDRLILYAILLCFIQILNLIIYRWFVYRNFTNLRFRLFWEKKLFLEMFSFAGWSTIGNFFYLFYTHGVNIMLNLFCGPSVNAARGLSIQVQGVVSNFSTNVQTAINPQIIKAYSQKDMNRMLVLMGASSRCCFYLLLMLELPLVLKVSYVLELWLGKYPEHLENFVILTLLSVLLNTLINPMFTANLATGNVKVYHTRLCIVSTLFIPITYYSLKYFHHPEIVFICIILMDLVGIIVRLFILRKQIGLSIRLYIRKIFFYIIKVFCLSSVLLFVLSSYTENNLIGLITTCLSSILIVPLTVFLCGVNNRERVYVTRKIKSKIFKV